MVEYTIGKVEGLISVERWSGAEVLRMWLSTL